MKEKYYHAEISRFDKNGFGEKTWGLYVSAEKCNVFSVEVAKDLLEQATKEYSKRFGKEVDFNFIKVDMGNRIGKYWRDKIGWSYIEMEFRYTKITTALSAAIRLL